MPIIGLVNPVNYGSEFKNAQLFIIDRKGKNHEDM
jgi:hypothetical protein